MKLTDEQERGLRDLIVKNLGKLTEITTSSLSYVRASRFKNSKDYDLLLTHYTLSIKLALELHAYNQLASEESLEMKAIESQLNSHLETLHKQIVSMLSRINTLPCK